MPRVKGLHRDAEHRRQLLGAVPRFVPKWGVLDGFDHMRVIVHTTSVGPNRTLVQFQALSGVSVYLCNRLEGVAKTAPIPAGQRPASLLIQRLVGAKPSPVTSVIGGEHLSEDVLGVAV